MHVATAMTANNKDLNMAKTKNGKKIVHVPAHTKSDGTKVKEHYRSTPN